MNTLHRKVSAAGIGALLIGGGAFIGVLASSLTTDTLVWRPQSHIPMTESPVAAGTDQVSSGQAWARTAFDGGLRQCPDINPDFLAACQAEIEKLETRPAYAPGSYGGPLLITKVERTTDDHAWDAQERLESYRPSRPPPEDIVLPDAPDDQPFEPTPANYPAAPADQPPA